MTDPFTLAVASVTAGLAVVTAWLHRSTPPELDGERWFKTAMATLLRGEVEAADADVARWVEAVKTHAPYHPAGRFPERKVAGRTHDLPARLEGETALIEQLAALPDAAARWRFLYEDDEVGLAARLDDPVELGPDYDPATWLGRGLGWDALADWGAGEDTRFPTALARDAPTWVLVHGRAEEPVLAELERLVEPTLRFDWNDLDYAPIEEALTPLFEDPARRYVFVAADAGVHTVLRLLYAKAPLRDRTDAVLSIGGLLRGLPGPDGPLAEGRIHDWMTANFTQQRLDVETATRVPYFCLQLMDRGSEPPVGKGIPVGHARFPEPRSEPMTPEAVQVVDLGLVFSDSPPGLIARALWATVVLWTRARTG